MRKDSQKFIKIDVLHPESGITTAQKSIQVIRKMLGICCEHRGDPGSPGKALGDVYNLRNNKISNN